VTDNKKIDTAALLASVDVVKVIDGYVPLTKSGAEFEACCPFHTESTPSFKVNPKKQFYNCFGCGANGDAIRFLMEYRGLPFLDACRELGADIPESGVPAGPPKPRKEIERAPVKAKKPEIEWLPVLPVPAQATEPPRAHSHRGVPVGSWAYRDAEGRLLGYIFKFIDSQGGKVTIPLTWCRAADGSAPEKWSWVSFPKPNRPLYGLDELARRPDAAVLVVEGEKCKDAAQAELPELVVIAWPGGCNAEDKVDWSPLAGRKVMTWADCDAKREKLKKEEKDVLQAEGAAAGLDDGAIKASIIAAQAAKPLLPESDQPGVKAMRRVHKHLHMFNCTVWDIRIPAPLEKPDGWDVADAIDEGLMGADLAAYVRSNAVRVPAPGAVDVIDPAALQLSQNSEGISTATGAAAGPGPGDVAAGGGGGGGSYGDEGWQGGGDDGHGQSIWRRMLLRSDGKVIDCRENVYLILKHHPQWQGVIWGDEFAKRIVLRKPPPWERAAHFVPERKWEASDDLRLGLWLAQQERVLIRAKQTLSDSVAWVASESLWHPVREYLEGLVWDDKPRLAGWLTDYLGINPTEYSLMVGRFFLIGMVARIYKPGCQMRFMPIFEGSQYRGKSSAIRALVGSKWYSDAHLDLNNKDVYQLIQGVWVQEVGEMDSFNRSEATRVKAFVSSQTDRFRAPYEATPSDQPRQVVFMGSTNQDEYFKDSTGNTRFWPLKAEETGDPINVEGLAAVRDQLFAEAVTLFKQGERWHPTAEEQERLFEPEQASREIEDLWESRIEAYLKSNTFTTIRGDEIITDCLKIEIGKVDNAKAMAMRVSTIMKRLGWRKDRETVGRHRRNFYQRPEEPKPAQPDSTASTSEVDDVPL